MSPVDRHEEARRRDADARRLAQSTFDRPFALEAGAGTGKTATLVARILVWCLGHGWERASHALSVYDTAGAAAERVAARTLQGVAAITFTESAAAEMEARISHGLSQLQNGELPNGLDPTLVPPPPERQRRAAALLTSLDHLLVRTIHAFCRRLLATYPLEAGLSPTLAIDADGSATRAVIVDVLEARLKTAYVEPCDPAFLALARVGIGPRDLAEVVDALIQAGAEPSAFEHSPFTQERVNTARRQLFATTARFVDVEDDRFRAARRASRTVAAARAIQHLRATLETHLGDATSLCEAVRICLDAVGDKLRRWSRGKLSKTEFEAVEGNVDAIVTAATALDQQLRALARVEPVLLEHLRCVVGPLLSDAYHALRARGVVTFAALLTTAKQLLAEHEQVRRQVRQGLTQILVDEFQDTDRVQCDIIRLLTFDGAADECPGLFLVGDPKQSIYGWRNADLLAYDELVAELVKRGGEVQRLCVSFRSPPPLLDEVERLVAPHMRRSHGLQPAFERLVPSYNRATHTGFVAGGRAAVEYWVSWRAEAMTDTVVKRTPGYLAADIEARALAADVQTLHTAHGVSWRDFAILLRSTGDLDVYVRALREAGVPYRVSRDRSYYRRREVIDAAALVRFVLDPNDTLALVTVLRSPFVGVPDAALLPLWSHDLPRRLGGIEGGDNVTFAEIAKIALAVANSIDPNIPGIDRIRGWEHALVWAARTIANLRTAFIHEPSDVFVERLRSVTLIEAVEAARYLGAYRVANLKRFFEHLQEALEIVEGDAPSVLRNLRRAVAEERDAEEAKPTDENDDALQLLTIHQAKGLDFSHVYIPQLHKGSAAVDRQETRVGVGDGAVEYTLRGYPTLGYGAVTQRDDEVAAAERVRLLYVATTRARDRLVLMGNWSRPDENAPAAVDRPGAPLIRLVETRNGVPPDLVQLMADVAKQETRGHIDEHGAAWLFPALLDGAATHVPSTRQRELDRPLSSHVLAEIAATLERNQQSARRRMSRPWLTTVATITSTVTTADQPGAASPSDLSPEVARAVGTTLHWLLQSVELHGGHSHAQQHFERLLSQTGSRLANLCPRVSLAEATAAIQQLTRDVAQGNLFSRLCEMGSNLIARELPLLSPPADAVDGVIAGVTGAIDLLYRDAESGELVVVDYKTDAVDGDSLAELVARYRPQAFAYASAVQDGLSLKSCPRIELWFLRPDRVVVIAPDDFSTTPENRGVAQRFRV